MHAQSAKIHQLHRRVQEPDMALLMNMFLNFGYLVCDFLDILAGGAGPLSFLLVVRYIMTGCLAFAGTLTGVRLLRRVTSTQGYALFGLYCFGLSLLVFILNLLA